MSWAAGLLAAAVCLPVLFAAGCGGHEPRTTPAARGAHDARSPAFPAPSTVGVPRGWKPARIRTRDLVVTKPGTVIEDTLFTNANLLINAPDVTVRRVKMQGGRISNWQTPECQNGLVVEDSTFEPSPGERYAKDSEGMTGVGGYVARRVKIWRREEGFRTGGRSAGCGPVRIEDSFAKISVPPGCPGDPHSDGIQGVDGPPLTVRNVTIDFTEASCGTAPFFVPDQQGNTTADVDGLLVMGGGATFRLGVPGRVRDLKIVDGTWGYFPVDVDCSLVRSWSADLVTITREYQVARTVGPQPCR
jgi:hypothetical protein